MQHKVLKYLNILPLILYCIDIQYDAIVFFSIIFYISEKSLKRIVLKKIFILKYFPEGEKSNHFLLSKARHPVFKQIGLAYYTKLIYDVTHRTLGYHAVGWKCLAIEFAIAEKSAGLLHFSKRHQALP